MKVGIECQKTMKLCSNTSTITILFLFIVAGTTSSQNISQYVQCPFDYIYHFGDGFTDIGNAIRVRPQGPSLPATRLPYGESFPTGGPTGRWSNGFIDVDYTAADLGLPNITPYLAMNNSANFSGVIFSVANSPVLDREFFTSRGINTVPSYVASLSLQISWFRNYIRSVCSNPTGCPRITSSIIIFGDIQANDVRYALQQGKSIQEIKTYVPTITQAQIEAGRELIRMGATRIAFTGNAPLGCFPDILTNLSSRNPLDYDALGCLKRVDDLIVAKNFDLKQAVLKLVTEYPNVTILYADYYTLARLAIAGAKLPGLLDGTNRALTACCGIGGRYNYDSNRFCGSPGVPVCSNPDSYIFWDGLHLTQAAYRSIERLLVRPLLPVVKCTIRL